MGQGKVRGPSHPTWTFIYYPGQRTTNIYQYYGPYRGVSTVIGFRDSGELMDKKKSHEKEIGLTQGGVIGNIADVGSSLGPYIIHSGKL